MRYNVWFVLFIAAILVTSACNSPQQNDQNKLELRLGMSRNNFVALFPDAYQDAGNSERYIKSDTIYGIAGRWVYHFSSNKLAWYVFNASQHDISKEVFDRYLKVATELTRSYDTEYGKAVKIRKGIQDYKDPVQRSHNGYLVQQASWDTVDGRRALEFTFLGDHKNYSLLLTIQVGQ